MADVRWPAEKSRFSDCLVERNGLRESGFEAWAFFPGMLFGAQGKWWGDLGPRARPHEGIDLCLYVDSTGRPFRVSESFRIPAMFSGEIVGIEEDFLGKSVFLGHEINDGQGRKLYTVYGHTKPAKGVRTGTRFRQGETIATLENGKNRNRRVFAHLHLSVAWVSTSHPPDRINWETLADPEKAILLDPLKAIDCPHRVLRPGTSSYMVDGSPEE